MCAEAVNSLFEMAGADGIYDERGKLQYFDGLILDNTEAKQLTQQLQLLSQSLRQAPTDD